MRTILFCLLVLFSSFLSCTKDEADATPETLLLGSWTITSVTGGISGSGYTPAFNVLHFKDATHYELLNAKAIIGQGTYTLFKKNGEDWIRFSPEGEPIQIFEIQEKKVTVEADHLILTDPCCDQYEYHFDK